MRLYLLDTNTVSHAIKGHHEVIGRLTAAPMAELCVSAVTEGELRYGLAKRPNAPRLHALVEAFLLRVNVMPWNREAAQHYGTTRAALSARGLTLAPLDLMIAAHALSVDATLVSNDRAFAQVNGLSLEDWTV